MLSLSYKLLFKINTKFKVSIFSYQTPVLCLNLKVGIGSMKLYCQLVRLLKYLNFVYIRHTYTLYTHQLCSFAPTHFFIIFSFFKSQVTKKDITTTFYPNSTYWQIEKKRNVFILTEGSAKSKQNIWIYHD